MTLTYKAWRAVDRLAVPLVLCGLLGALVVIFLGGHAEIIQKVLATDCPAGQKCTVGDLVKVQQVADNLKGPVTVVLGSISGLGAAAGGAMLAAGHQGAIRIIVASVGAGAAVLVGNGVIA